MGCSFLRGIWEIVTEVVLTTVVILWRPTERFEDYQTHTQLATEEGETTEPKDVGAVDEGREYVISPITSSGYQSMSIS